MGWIYNQFGTEKPSIGTIERFPARPADPSLVQRLQNQELQTQIKNATHSTELERGRTAYYDEENDTLVIVDPNSVDGGTVFRPSDGIEGFDELDGEE